MIRGAGRIAGCLCLELDRQLARLDLNADNVVADEVSVITFCGILEVLAHGGCDASLDLRRRHPAHRSGTSRLSVQEGRFRPNLQRFVLHLHLGLFNRIGQKQTVGGAISK